MSENVIEVRDFRKAYGSHLAVAGISFAVQRGEIFGLLGPNGAGKTSTLECLEGLRRPDGGALRILGVDPARDTRRLWGLIGVQLQTLGLPVNWLAFVGLAYGAQVPGGALLPVLVLLAGGVSAFALAIALFRWDSRNVTRRLPSACALLALVPYVVGMVLLG